MVRGAGRASRSARDKSYGQSSCPHKIVYQVWYCAYNILNVVLRQMTQNIEATRAKSPNIGRGRVGRPTAGIKGIFQSHFCSCSIDHKHVCHRLGAAWCPLDRSAGRTWPFQRSSLISSYDAGSLGGWRVGPLSLGPDERFHLRHDSPIDSRNEGLNRSRCRGRDAPSGPADASSVAIYLD